MPSFDVFVQEWLALTRLGDLPPKPWKALTTGLVHLGWPHLAANVLTLTAIGRCVEPKYGRYSVVLGLSFGVLAGLGLEALINQWSVVGLSGGIAALYGFLAIKEPARFQSVRRGWIFWLYGGFLAGSVVVDLIGVMPWRISRMFGV